MFGPPATGKDPEQEAFKKKYKKSYKDADDEAARHFMFKAAQRASRSSTS